MNDIFMDRKEFKPEIKPEELDYDFNIWKNYFYSKNVDLSKLKLSNIGIYSITKPYYAQLTSSIIKKYFNNMDNIIITDANGNMGGNTINFANNFKKVNAVEILKLHYDILENNIKVYNLDHKVNFYHKDYLDIMFKLKQDVIYIDAPWGGKDYKNKNKIDLFLDNVNLIHITNKLINNAKLIVLKLPLNFNLNKFYETSLFTKLNLYKIKNSYKKIKYYLLFLS